MDSLGQNEATRDTSRLRKLPRDASVSRSRSPEAHKSSLFGDLLNQKAPLQEIQNIKAGTKHIRSRPAPNPFFDPQESATKRLRIDSPFNKERYIDPTKADHSGSNIRLKLHHAQADDSHVQLQEQELQRHSHQEQYDESNYDDIPSDVRDEIIQIQEAFPLLRSKYRLLDRIGEGTFSTVYKAEPLSKEAYYLMGDRVYSSPDIKNRKSHRSHKKHYVALKRIYVTSSPQRILNELNLLFILSGSPYVAPLLDAVRQDDQIIAVLPYYEHIDFREFYRDLPIAGIKSYMSELLEGLKFVHTKRVIHRDIKPTNFLYDPFKKKGVLVDFGLAEPMKESDREPTDKTTMCPCKSGKRFPLAPTIQKNGTRKNDTRGGRRANRAGTRGFRAPEVLFKCPHQTTKIDVWSVGVILLTFLARRFPFFNSRDDVDALVELTAVFGLMEMKKAAYIHGLGLETTLDTLQQKLTLPQIIYKCLLLEVEKDTLPEDSVAYETFSLFNKHGEIKYDEDEPELIKQKKREHLEAFEVMESCLKLDPKDRLSAAQALDLPFFRDDDDDDDDMILLE